MRIQNVRVSRRPERSRLKPYQSVVEAVENMRQNRLISHIIPSAISLGSGPGDFAFREQSQDLSRMITTDVHETAYEMKTEFWKKSFHQNATPSTSLLKSIAILSILQDLGPILCHPRNRLNLADRLSVELDGIMNGKISMMRNCHNTFEDKTRSFPLKFLIRSA
jgi:hypothetical protein